MKLKDLYFARNPLSWRWVFRRAPSPTALQLATTALEECRCERLEQHQAAEYHKAMTTMLEQREKRLQADIARLSGGTPVIDGL